VQCSFFDKKNRFSGLLRKKVDNSSILKVAKFKKSSVTTARHSHVLVHVYVHESRDVAKKLQTAKDLQSFSARILACKVSQRNFLVCQSLEWNSLELRKETIWRET
jgi:hypothetical protein